MEYMGRLISDDRDPLYFDFDREFDDDGDVEGFDGMLQHIREVTSDEDEALRLLTQKVAEKFVRYNVTSRKKNCLKDNNDARCVKPLETSEMRGNRDHIPFISKKKRSDNKKKSRSYFFSSVGRTTRAEDKIAAQRKQKKRIRGRDERGEGAKRSTGKKKRKVEKVCLKKLGFDQLDFSDEIKPLISWQEGSDEDFKLRITKRLFQTDMSDYHDRLSMPVKQIKNFEGFLNDEENMELAKPKSETKGIEVKLFDLTGASHIETMRLRKWDMNTSSCLMLTTSWKSVLNKGVLQENDFVQIYSFRRNENLCFVLVKVCDGQGCRDGAFGSRSNAN